MSCFSEQYGKDEEAVKRKLLTALILVWTVACAASVSAWAAEPGYPDAQGHYAQKAIETWSGYGVLKGYPDGSFQPDRTISRAELAAVLDRVMGYQNRGENIYPGTCGGSIPKRKGVL